MACTMSSISHPFVLFIALVLISCFCSHQAAARNLQEVNFPANPETQLGMPAVTGPYVNEPSTTLKFPAKFPAKFPIFQEPVIPPHFFPMLPFPGMPTMPTGPNFPSLPAGPNYPSMPAGPNYPSLPAETVVPSTPTDPSSASSVPPAFPVPSEDLKQDSSGTHAMEKP